MNNNENLVGFILTNEFYSGKKNAGNVMATIHFDGDKYVLEPTSQEILLTDKMGVCFEEEGAYVSKGMFIDLIEILTEKINEFKSNKKVTLEQLKKMGILLDTNEKKSTELTEGFVGDIVEVLYHYCANLNFNCHITCGRYAYKKLEKIADFLKRPGYVDQLDLNGEHITIYNKGDLDCEDNKIQPETIKIHDHSEAKKVYELTLV